MSQQQQLQTQGEGEEGKKHQQQQQQPTEPVSKAPPLGQEKEQWLVNMKFPCVHCRAIFETRTELLKHYDGTRHDKYSAFK